MAKKIKAAVVRQAREDAVLFTELRVKALNIAILCRESITEDTDKTLARADRFANFIFTGQTKDIPKVEKVEDPARVKELVEEALKGDPNAFA